MASYIPPLLREKIEAATGAVISDEVARGGGGASRQGAEVTLRYRDGTAQHAYLSWDGRAADPARKAYFDRETAVLAALSGPLADAGVKVAGMIAAVPEFLAHLSRFQTGQDRFPLAEHKAEIAADFINQLANLHRIDAASPHLAALGDAAIPPSQRILANLQGWRADHLAAHPEPIFQLALDWLIENIPPDDGPSVLVHGDAGPGNFLFEDRRITAVVDWELVHFGDPVEDLAQIAVRSLIQPFIPMEEVIRLYEQASGRPINVARLNYYRLYFQISFLVTGHIAQSKIASAPNALGQAMLFATMHRRVMVQALADEMGLTLIDQPLPDGDAHFGVAGFDTALEDLREEILPNLNSQRAAAKAKSLARLIKYWRNRAAYGAAFDAEEQAELSAALGAAMPDVAAGRSQLAAALAEGRVTPADALQLCHNRMRRETRLMAEAMGKLATTYYERAGSA